MQNKSLGIIVPMDPESGSWSRYVWYSEFKKKNNKQNTKQKNQPTNQKNQKTNTKLNLTRDFCNSSKDLCNVFLKLKWTIKSIGGKKGRKSVFVIRLQYKRQFSAFEAFAVAVKQVPIVQSSLLIFNGPGSMNSLEHIFNVKNSSVYRITKWLNYQVLFENQQDIYSQCLLIPSQPAILTLTVNRTQCPFIVEEILKV